MRKTCVVLCILVLFICSSGLLLGSGIDNKTNWSTGYIRTLNRNAVYDNPDAVVYNPAGVVKLDPGFNIGVHNQFVFKEYSHTLSTPPGTSYSASNPTWLLPSAFLTYNFERWAVYGAFYISGGGGKLDYKDGIADINEAAGAGLAFFNPSFIAKSLYYTGAAGGVFAINDMFSIAASGKIVYGLQEVDSVTETPVPPLGNTTDILHLKETATGFGGVFGLNIAIPAMETNIGIRYETKVKLDWEMKESGTGALDPAYGSVGDKRRQDLPAMLALGASFKPFTGFKTEASFNYYFNKSANWDGLEDYVQNGWEAGIMAEYAFIPELLGSFGVLYANPGADQDSYIYLNPALKSFSVGGGVLWHVKPAIALELGVLKPFYFDDDGYSQPPASIPVSLSKSVWIVAIGASFHI